MKEKTTIQETVLEKVSGGYKDPSLLDYCHCNNCHAQFYDDEVEQVFESSGCGTAKFLICPQCGNKIRWH